jgi:hypothetical protein
MTYPLYALAILYLLWIHYVFVMALKRARDAETLTRVAYWLGMPMLVIGLILDALVNIVVMTVILLEFPREWLVTGRLKRHAPDATWRGAVARWFALHLLDSFDPSGRHV